MADAIFATEGTSTGAQPRDIVCVYCERTRPVNRNGKVRMHRSTRSGPLCQGSGRRAEFMPLAPIRYPGRRP